jgi:hypothetical protein
MNLHERIAQLDPTEEGVLFEFRYPFFYIERFRHLRYFVKEGSGDWIGGKPADDSKGLLTFGF